MQIAQTIMKYYCKQKNGLNEGDLLYVDTISSLGRKEKAIWETGQSVVVSGKNFKKWCNQCENKR